MFQSCPGLRLMIFFTGPTFSPVVTDDRQVFLESATHTTKWKYLYFVIFQLPKGKLELKILLPPSNFLLPRATRPCHSSQQVRVPGQCMGCAMWAQDVIYRDHFVNASSQWETTLQCNVSHWLGSFTKWSLDLWTFYLGQCKVVGMQYVFLEQCYKGNWW